MKTGDVWKWFGGAFLIVSLGLFFTASSGLVTRVIGMTPLSVSADSGWTVGQQHMLDLGLPNESVGTIVTTIVYALLVLLGAGSTIAFILAGFKYLMASGDEKEAGIAKNMLKYSITGIVVALAGVVIIQAVTMLLNGSTYF